MAAFPKIYHDDHPFYVYGPTGGTPYRVIVVTGRVTYGNEQTTRYFEDEAPKPLTRLEKLRAWTREAIRVAMTRLRRARLKRYAVPVTPARYRVCSLAEAWRVRA